MSNKTLSNRLEAGPIVQNMLKNIGNKDELAFLKRPVDIAIDILHIIQNIEGRKVNTEFANLALDACGLVYIVIHQSSENINQPTAISRYIQSDGKEALERSLEEARIFVREKAEGTLMRRMNPWKWYEDKKNIKHFSEVFGELKLKFGPDLQGSMNDSLQDIIYRKMNGKIKEENPTPKLTPEVLIRNSSDAPNLLPTLLDDNKHYLLQIPYLGGSPRTGAWSAISEPFHKDLQPTQEEEKSDQQQNSSVHRDDQQQRAVIPNNAQISFIQTSGISFGSGVINVIPGIPGTNR